MEQVSSHKTVHILKNARPINLPDGSTLDTGEWLVQDDNAFQLALMAERGTAELSRWSFCGDKSTLRVTEGEIGSPVSQPRSILLIRSGAIGDLLLLSPCIEPLRNKYPSARIYLSCFERHDSIAEGFGLDALYPYPINTSLLLGMDLIIPLENVVELSTEQGIHATDAFAEALGVTVTDYKPVYNVTDEERERLTEMDAPFQREEQGWVKSQPKPRVALQLHSSSVIRNYPLQQWNAVIKTLLDRGWEIMLLGKQDGVKGGPPALKDCSGLSFREAAAVLATCDVFCGVDSSFFNLCPALGVPAIGLFGPVDWKTRIKDLDKQRALCTPAPCAPCGWTNSRAGRKFPAHGPCSSKGFCVPLAAIEPERIVAKIDAYRK